MTTESNVGWPTHGAHGRHDWATYIERGYVAPFRDAVRDLPDVDVPVDDSARTMLMEVLAFAGGEQWLEIVSLLIGAGADVNRRDAGGRPVWDFAPTWGPHCIEFWQRLINAGAEVNSRGAKNETPLHRVCSVYTADHATIRSLAQLLLRAGAEVNVADEYGDTPLHAAAQNGHTEVVRDLLDAGALANITARSGRSPLHNAALFGHARVAQFLIQAGADFEAVMPGSRARSYPVFTSGYVDVQGVTPLIAAAEGGHFDVVRLLADAGADVNRADASGFTPLMGAARMGHSGMAKFLLERGADREARDSEGRSAEAHATEFQHLREIAPILRHKLSE